jgi:hypothetical protein
VRLGFFVGLFEPFLELFVGLFGAPLGLLCGAEQRSHIKLIDIVRLPFQLVKNM